MEPSATLRRALQKRLSEYDYELCAVACYTAALKELKEPPSGRDTLAVIVSHPAHPTTASDEFFAALHQSEHAGTAVVLLTHSATSETFDWVARRPGSILLLWDDYADCPNALRELLTPTVPDQVAAHVIDDIRVMFVDDARTVRVAYERLLTRHGYAVESAADIAEAMKLALARPFDIAIVDYHMPGGNGDQLCRQLREHPRTADMTTAILTGTYLDQVIKDSLDAGAIECMFKNEPHELFLTRLAAMSRAIRAKKSIEAERQRLAGILASVGDGVYGVNRSGQITFINPAARLLLGLKNVDGVIGRSAHKLFHYANEDGRVNAPETCFLQQAYAAGNELRALETVFWHRSGTAVPVECTVYPLRVEDRLEGSVVAFRDVSERKQRERELVWQASHDAITHLHNRSYFERALEAEVSRLKRSNEVSALLYLDLDRFKYINDTAGHAAGDRLLSEIAAQLRARARDADLLARLGGDEFAILLRNVTEDGTRAVAEGFREVLEQLNFSHGGKHFKVNGSVGAALIDHQTDSPEVVLANADIACHVAKSRGRNQTHVFRPGVDEKERPQREIGWSTRLQEALRGDGFRLVYQPIVAIDAALADVASAEHGQLWHHAGSGGRHYEVLVRFVDAAGDLVAPGAFLPAAERFGLMPQLDAWIVTRALGQLAQLRAHDPAATFTINLSGQMLDDEQLLPLLHRLLDQYQIDPHYLIFEITEANAIANLDAAKRLINDLRTLGCRFALDDFGSGFSSFYHLKHLPVDFIKIDGHLVRGMRDNPEDRAIVGAINDIAHSFGKRTVAEFVENRDIFGMLRAYGVDFAQGHYIAFPQDSVGI